MKQDEDLWKKEERFWLGDAEFYEQALAPDAIMVLPPPAGILDHGNHRVHPLRYPVAGRIIQQEVLQVSDVRYGNYCVCGPRES